MYLEGLAFDQGLDIDVSHSGEDLLPMVNFGISKWLDMTGFQKRSGSVVSLLWPCVRLSVGSVGFMFCGQVSRGCSHAGTHTHRQTLAT